MVIQLFRKPVVGSEVPVPPRKLVEQVGGGDFTAIGNEFFGYFTQLSRLRPDEQVLDVGCGCGRMAVPLTRYLTAEGGYEGFDIQPQAIRWCLKNITARYANFGFTVADVFNKSYNPRGRVAAGDYRFPYEDNRFDYVFLTSVFTHMLRSDMEHYLDEIVRVMKPHGRCLLTYFLLADESLALIEAGRSALSFPHEVAGTAVMSHKQPEAAVAFPVDYVRGLLRERGLTLEEPIRFGSWSGNAGQFSFQDIVLAHR